MGLPTSLFKNIIKPKQAVMSGEIWYERFKEEYGHAQFNRDLFVKMAAKRASGLETNNE